jgi:methylmalonyl-CoA mutase cobalamin-binding subunit
VAMAGGTNGGSKVIKAYFEAGIGTLVVMHMPEDVIKEVREQGIGNIVVAGHMASDSVGLNILAKAYAERGIEVIRGSGIVTPGAR